MGDSVYGSSSSVSSTSETPENTAKFVHFPHKDFITFPQKIDKDKAEGKLRELNSKNGDTLNEEQVLKMIDNPNSLDLKALRPVFDAWEPSDAWIALEILRHVSGTAQLDSETAKELLAHCYNLLSPTTRNFDLVTCTMWDAMFLFQN